MSLTLNDEGRILARIEGGELNKNLVSVITDNIKKQINMIKIKKGKFQQVPDPNKERNILYITGPSGSGKSTYTANYTKIYKKLYPNNPVYVFSALKDDESLDVIKPKRIKISKETLIDDPINMEDLRNCLVIFDDIDCISNKDLRIAVYNILNEVLETGRHFFCSCIITNHLPSNGSYTRRILNECMSITYFPHSGNNGKMKKFLIDQVGIDKNDYLKNKKAKSRWATVYKNYPMINMTEQEIRLLNDVDDEEINNHSKMKKTLKNKNKNDSESETETESENENEDKNKYKKKY